MTGRPNPLQPAADAYRHAAVLVRDAHQLLQQHDQPAVPAFDTLASTLDQFAQIFEAPDLLDAGRPLDVEVDVLHGYAELPPRPLEYATVAGLDGLNRLCAHGWRYVENIGSPGAPAFLLEREREQPAEPEPDEPSPGER